MATGTSANKLDVAGRACLHRVFIWYNLVAASAARGVLFAFHNVRRPSVPILVGNATLIVSQHVYV
jgi:hypothetical protein